jgi:hypothetical protein
MRSDIKRLLLPILNISGHQPVSVPDGYDDSASSPLRSFMSPSPDARPERGNATQDQEDCTRKRSGINPKDIPQTLKAISARKKCSNISKRIMDSISLAG